MTDFLGASWLVDIYPNRVEKYMGKFVESKKDLIFEGAWAGDLTKNGLLSSHFRCGSGVAFFQDYLVIAAPSHSIEAIYIFISNNRIVASNSVQLIIALDNTFAPVESDFEKIITVARTLTLGRSEYGRLLYHNKFGKMLRLAWGTYRVDFNSFRVEETAPLSNGNAPFSNFHEYHKYLLRTLNGLIKNAQHQSRQKPFNKLLTTVSSGYDSTACAALAKGLGCKEALTIKNARSNKNDSGVNVAKNLGLSVYEYERIGSKLEEKNKNNNVYYVDAEKLEKGYDDFFGTINDHGDIYFEPFRKHLDQSILFTGFHGDKVWDKNCLSGASIKRGDTSGTGIDEFRKRIGFINVPIPYIGAEYNNQIKKINWSAEMKPFRIGWNKDGSSCVYDRPIPRRIAEEKGVKRENFGQLKLAGSFIFKSSLTRRKNAFNKTIANYRKFLPEKTVNNFSLKIKWINNT